MATEVRDLLNEQLTQGVPDTEALLPPRVDVNGTVRKLLLSALARFAERGYHAVPVREIAAGAGIRASSIYEHRASKEDLLLELMLIGHEQHRVMVSEAVAKAGDDPVEQLRAFMHAHVLMHTTYPVLARVCNRELHSLSPEGLARVMQVRVGAEEVMLSVIQRGIRAGVFRVPDPWLAMAAIGAMGIRVAEWYGPGSPYSPEDVASSYARLALAMLGDGEVRTHQ